MRNENKVFYHTQHERNMPMVGTLGVLEGLRSYPKYCSYNRFADRWRHTEQYVSNADKSYKLAHKNDNYLNKILQIGFVEKNVYTFTFILTSGLLMVCEAALAAYFGWKYGSLFFVKSIGMVLVFLQMFGMFYTIHCIVESFVVQRKIKRLSNYWLTNE